ncbi:endonuclease/exonuclease/phosphatase family protein [Seonamhaeicola maritimus]|uniref:Endonuclease/exonuclease/phosphatase family protein n=1 Tax=Seonamhaeicola maritimus TaxID=2591822 RepID=A0A5C7GGX2_9FLAO|nr:endonuclease/exonuclease/phosphatase family protein [Seonamhaeicola maritimus]TXG36916.1 endonuclease/exonuclease/phosphatase family protein [Seonamhaeicola maritimus]
MKHLKICLSLLLIVFSINTNAQDKKFKIHTVAFYNLENLFDTINNPNKLDEYSPIMELKTGRKEAYKKKVNNMAEVLAVIGSKTAQNTPSIIGVCEVENNDVLEDLINHPLLIDKDYGIIHYDAPDARGIDVALLYKKSAFTPLNSSTHGLKIYDDQDQSRIYTRDQLLVSGNLEGELIHVIVNHWPSRRGGEARSNPKRVAAARVSKRIIDSLQSIDPYSKVILMGDLNDNPTNASVKDVLNAKESKSDVGLKGLYNPFTTYYKNGLGTTAYRDIWNLFDQIIISKPLLNEDTSSLRYYKANIFNAGFLTHSRGKYKGYPFRSWSNGSFSNGYSDHYPVYVYLIKEVE